MMPSNQHGSYLVLQKTHQHDIYMLYVRDHNMVRHYTIRKLNKVLSSFCIAGKVFHSIQHLVAHYQQQADGLCVNLRYPWILPQTTDISEKTYVGDIDRHELKLLKKLGTGLFGEVWAGLWKETTPVAVKIMSADISPWRSYEGYVLKRLNHPKIIHLYGNCTKEMPNFIVTEFMKYGSLLEYLHGEGRSLKPPKMIDIATQVAAGMAYLEEHDWIHRDLGARNILVGDGDICKVANFCLAVLVDGDICESDYEICDKEYVDYSGMKYPVKWIAVESIQWKRFSIKSDVWSFGIVLWELITYGFVPYPGMTNSQVTEQLQQGYRMPRPCLLYTSPSPRDATLSRMPSSA